MSLPGSHRDRRRDHDTHRCRVCPVVLSDETMSLAFVGEKNEQMKSITGEIRDRIKANLVEARVFRRHGEWGQCWELLEDAHILSQPWGWWHTRVHTAMLLAGWKARDSREVRGQLVRLVVGGPASAVGRYPVGNTGRARVRATQPMSVRSDLAEMLTRAGRPVG